MPVWAACERTYVVRVAIKTGLTIDDKDLARRYITSQLVREDTRRGFGTGDDRDIWVFSLEAANLQAAVERAVAIVSDAFTDVDPEAEVVGVAWYGDR